MIPKAVILACALLIGGTGLVGFREAKPVTPEEESFDIVYEVKCSTCDVVFRNSEGEPERIYEIQKHWELAFEGAKGQFVYVSATNQDGTETIVSIKRGSKVMIVGTSKEQEKTARAGLIL